MALSHSTCPSFVRALCVYSSLTGMYIPIRWLSVKFLIFVVLPKLTSLCLSSPLSFPRLDLVGRAVTRNIVGQAGSAVGLSSASKETQARQLKKETKALKKHREQRVRSRQSGIEFAFSCLKPCTCFSPCIQRPRPFASCLHTSLSLSSVRLCVCLYAHIPQSLYHASSMMRVSVSDAWLFVLATL